MLACVLHETSSTACQLWYLPQILPPTSGLRGRVSSKTGLLALLLWPISGLGVTAGAHRYWTHHSYKASTILETLGLHAHSAASTLRGGQVANRFPAMDSRVKGGNGRNNWIGFSPPKRQLNAWLRACCYHSRTPSLSHFAPLRMQCQGCQVLDASFLQGRARGI